MGPIDNARRTCDNMPNTLMRGHTVKPYEDLIGPIPEREKVDGYLPALPNSELNTDNWSKDSDVTVLVQAGMKPIEAIELINEAFGPKNGEGLSVKDAMTVRLMTGPHDQSWKRVAEISAYRAIADEIEAGRLDVGYARTGWERENGGRTMQLMAVSADTVQITRIRESDGFMLHDRDFVVADGRVAAFMPRLEGSPLEDDTRDLSYRIEGARQTRRHLLGDETAAAAIPDMEEARARILARHSVLGTETIGHDAPILASWSMKVAAMITPSSHQAAEAAVDPYAGTILSGGVMGQARSITGSSPASAKGKAENDMDMPAAWKAMSQKSTTKH